MKKTYVTKAFLPPLDEYMLSLSQIWDRGIVTNQGQFLHELEQNLARYLDIDKICCVNNGTSALLLALSALDIHDAEVITTPFSYVASSSAILWQGCKPVYVDINRESFTIDVDKIEQAITPKTKAILAVHVFGLPCNVEKIQEIADKYNLKVIYDAAHAFASIYKNKSLLSYGDVSTASFHATKVFNTIEGGACVAKDKSILDKLELQKRFGHDNDDYICLGINAKLSELHAAVGLINLKYIDNIILARKNICEIYDSELSKNIFRPQIAEGLVHNYSYYPVLFNSEKHLLDIFEDLSHEGIHPRRYFYPSLNTLPYVQYQACPISEDISQRIACLPLYDSLEHTQVHKIIKIINKHCGA